MFGMATMKGVHVIDATLSRPYLFFLLPIMAGTWAFLALCLVVGGLVWAISVGITQTATRDLEQRRLQQDDLLREPTPIGNSGRIIREAIEDARQETWTSEPGSRSIQMITLLTHYFTYRVHCWHQLLGSPWTSRQLSHRAHIRDSSFCYQGRMDP